MIDSRLLFSVLSSIWEDFANQVRWSADYAAACKKANHAAGKVLNPLAGEFFSGLVRSKFHPKAMTVLETFFQ